MISVLTGNLVNLTFEHSLYEAFETNDSVELLDGQSAHDKMIFKASVHEIVLVTSFLFIQLEGT